MRPKQSDLHIITLSILAVAIVFVCNQVLSLNYLWATVLKVIAFVLVPVGWQFLTKRRLFLVPIHHRIKDVLAGLMLGSASFVVLISAYFVLGRFIDFSAILSELSLKSEIDATNFLWVGLYITLGNSFVEEFFFRGFIFLNLEESGHLKTAHAYSATLFAVYHIAIFKSWFSPLLMTVAIVGLMVIGLVFNYVNKASKSILNSWLIHIMADSAIILIGMWLFRLM
ncbi:MULTISPECIES: CPBP family intramembrane glutamic endopeptidase [unclassified Fusibacter]|uniref:CPBP family intramembrane glutamic endopeptidase n=1 Tax=unclassified Fusibacter TaxID=2624464 RepID=UPI0010133764|nr:MULTISPECIES: type II CAAX endopeptidase family protein [unclassified Fusibacter]MCK8060644.1 CPBP family intramembrane metalloprotease [Fusibacter sp. A2]NPE22902.1 CPBP family intramembrane metalloprotease [Fusibacter sp. A1]RXV59971.1 CPBP family intramembrane metalloprotease [Fusibacter sp. A1]